MQAIVQIHAGFERAPRKGLANVKSADTCGHSVAGILPIAR